MSMHSESDDHVVQLKGASDFALDYLNRGWMPIRVKSCSKKPKSAGWPNERYDAESIQRKFKDGDNIGILLGDASSGLIDVDLDHPMAVELAPKFLPATGARFGGKGKRCSHYLYVVDHSERRKEYKAPSGQTIVEYRGNGAQTVFPGSTHESGEPIQWEEDGDGEPAAVSSSELQACIERLHREVLRRLGLDGQAPREVSPVELLHRRASSYIAKAASVAEGGRDDAAFKLAGHLAALVTEDGQRLSEGEILDLMRPWNNRNEPPLEEAQLLKCVQSGMRKGAPRKDKVVRLNQKRQQPANPGRRIVVSTDESRVTDEAVAALADVPTIFQRAGFLVQVVRGAKLPKGVTRPPDAPSIALVKPARLRELLASAVVWVKEDEKTFCHPPGWTVKQVEARGEWRSVLPLEGVIETPTLKPDGTILQTPGYDEDMALLYEPAASFPPVPGNPTVEDVGAARDELLEVVCDFPFELEAHRAAWLASVLTPLAQYAYGGPAPLMLFDANMAAAGKGLCVDTSTAISLGRCLARTTWSENEEEIRKRITAVALGGYQAVLIDNVSGELGSPSLDAALTSTSWQDRVLGVSEMTRDIPLNVVWFATGNNMVLKGDTARRSLHIRLDVLHERPEERSGFKHPDLKKWIASERPRLVAAALTILRGYCAAGRPNMNLTPWGSFEGWSDLVRSAVVWCGLPDPGATRQLLAAATDQTKEAIFDLLAGWFEIDPGGKGMTSAELVERLKNQSGKYKALRHAFEELVPGKNGGPPSTKSVGMKLRNLRRRVIGGMYLDSKPDSSPVIWVVRTVGSQGSGGFVSDPEEPPTETCPAPPADPKNSPQAE